MNRLILVGNGFDLAHGFKTSYKDFILWYLDYCFSNAGLNATGDSHEDEIIKIQAYQYQILQNLSDRSAGKGISRYLYENGLLKNYLYCAQIDVENRNSIWYQRKDTSGSVAHFVIFKSPFLKRLIESCLECGWVDIEQEYFNELKQCNDPSKASDLRALNDSLEFLKTKLEEYLTLEEKKHLIICNQELVDILNSPFEPSDFDTVLNKENIFPQTVRGEHLDSPKDYTTYILNFNYTNTFQAYKEKILSNRKILNYIHGELNNSLNPIIFGFGDEHDKEYIEFEERRDNNLFEHVKSYHYLQTSNYRNLIRFLNADNYQVFVIGHSCGLSDRTMFKEIFDHQHCKSVRIFHYTNVVTGKNDFFDKSINLSRHFSDKGRMRKLVVEFNKADALPQFEMK